MAELPTRTPGAWRRATSRLGRIALIAAITVALAETTLRIRAARESAACRLDLGVTATAFPPPFSGSCARAPDATLGQLIRPSRVPDLLFELKPRADTCYRGARVVVNADGLRAPAAYDRPKPAGVYRVLLLGDSQAFGQGVTYEQTFGALLERALQERARAERVEVINAGVPAYNTVQEAAFYASAGTTYRPDCVLILFIGNDLEIPEFMLAPDDGLALDRLFLADALADLSWAARRKLGYSGFELRPSFLPRVPPALAHLVGLDAYEKALRRIAETARGDGARVVDLADYRAESRRGGRRRAAEIVELQRRLGIAVPAFSFPRDLGYRQSDSDRHLNPAGHAELMRRVLAAVSEECPRVR